MTLPPRICTLTIKKDSEVEYEDDGWYRRELGRSVPGEVGSSRLTRDVVTLLGHWVATSQRCRRDELMVLGKALYEIAFGVATAGRTTPRTAFEETVKTCQVEKRTIRFRLVLDTDDRVLASYPWEFLFLDDPDGDGFFLAGQNTQLTLTRYVPNTDPWNQAFADDDVLRIVVVVSTPRIPEMAELSVGPFVDYLCRLDPRRFKVSVIRCPTRKELRVAIAANKPHVVHFIGHGQQGRLAFQKDPQVLADELADWEDARAARRNPAPVSEAEWADSVTASDVLVAGNDLDGAPRRLIFLHACEGATAAETQTILGTFNDVARTLARKPQITGVIAMQYTISVEEAELFAKTFYDGICDGARVDDAIRQARQVFAEIPLRGQQSWDSRGFGTPVSYLRREEPLITRRAKTVEPPPIVASAAQPVIELSATAPCPNGRCPGGKVLRNARVPRCRVCQEPYAPCPGPDCGFLIVSKPGWHCLNCDYRFGDPIPAEPATGDLTPEASGPRSVPNDTAITPRSGSGSSFSSGDARPFDRPGSRGVAPPQPPGSSPQGPPPDTIFLGQTGGWHSGPAGAPDHGDPPAGEEEGGVDGARG